MKFILAEVDKGFEDIFEGVKINIINCFKRRQFNSTKLKKISGKFTIDKKKGICLYITGDIDGTINGVSLVDDNVNPIKVDDDIRNTVKHLIKGMIDDSVLSKS